MLTVPDAATHSLDELRAWPLDQIARALHSGRLILGRSTEALVEVVRLSDPRYIVANSGVTRAVGSPFAVLRPQGQTASTVLALLTCRGGRRLDARRGHGHSHPRSPGPDGTGTNEAGPPLEG